MTATGMAAMTDEELIARLRDLDTWVETADVPDLAADRIEALVRERDAVITARDMMGNLWAKEKARAERLEAALHNCVGMLDQLVAESGRDIEWGAEDPFRMGEWFEPEDLAQIKQARAALSATTEQGHE